VSWVGLALLVVGCVASVGTGVYMEQQRKAQEQMQRRGYFFPPSREKNGEWVEKNLRELHNTLQDCEQQSLIHTTTVAL